MSVRITVRQWYSASTSSDSCIIAGPSLADCADGIIETGHDISVSINCSCERRKLHGHVWRCVPDRCRSWPGARRLVLLRNVQPLPYPVLEYTVCEINLPTIPLERRVALLRAMLLLFLVLVVVRRRIVFEKALTTSLTVHEFSFFRTGSASFAETFRASNWPTLEASLQLRLCIRNTGVESQSGCGVMVETSSAGALPAWEVAGCIRKSITCNFIVRRTSHKNTHDTPLFSSQHHTTNDK
ncbi:hypothetical protein CBL_05980 [Carabus blaptoides fortunei]